MRGFNGLKYAETIYYLGVTDLVKMAVYLFEQTMESGNSFRLKEKNQSGRELNKCWGVRISPAQSWFDSHPVRTK